MENLLLRSDSYKMSHWKAYPDGADGYFGYVEARSNKRWSKSVFFGLQIFLKKYLSKPFTKEDIVEAKEFCNLHGVPFNKEGWEYILDKYNGYIPVTIKAVPEGMVIDNKLPLCTVECLDNKVFWVGSWLETSLLQALWYPISVATNSWSCKQVIKQFMEQTCDNIDGLDFKLHDFGYRGCSSQETAGIGGASHLVNFKGSDTIIGIYYANKYYNCEMTGFSIPASEHSVICSFGKENELQAYKKMLDVYAKPRTIVACVSDSYDIYNACGRLWGEKLRQQIIDSGTTLVVRPDSGDPEEVSLKCIEILGDKFGYTYNSKGYKVLSPCVRVIYGDGINEKSIANILGNLKVHNWSADNIAFGMGGALLQDVQRDDLSFAMKCSAIRINGEWKEVMKDPITDLGKRSKTGRISLYQKGHGKPEYVCLPVDYVSKDPKWEDKKIHLPEVLNIVYEMNQGYAMPFIKEITFAEVRNNSNKGY